MNTTNTALKSLIPLLFCMTIHLKIKKSTMGRVQEYYKKEVILASYIVFDKSFSSRRLIVLSFGII